LNNFLKLAYEVGAREACTAFGITKEGSAALTGKYLLPGGIGAMVGAGSAEEGNRLMGALGGAGVGILGHRVGQRLGNRLINSRHPITMSGKVDPAKLRRAAKGGPSDIGLRLTRSGTDDPAKIRNTLLASMGLVGAGTVAGGYLGGNAADLLLGGR